MKNSNEKTTCKVLIITIIIGLLAWAVIGGFGILGRSLVYSVTTYNIMVGVLCISAICAVASIAIVGSSIILYFANKEGSRD